MYIQPHLSLYDTTTQTIVTANTEQLITFDTTAMAKKIVKTSSSRFTFNEGGAYEVQITAQVTCSAANKILDIWTKLSGTNADGNNKTIVVNNEVKIMSTTFCLDGVTAGQYLEVWMSGDNDTLRLISYTSDVTPTRPLTPSIRLTITKLS